MIKEDILSIDNDDFRWSGKTAVPDLAVAAHFLSEYAVTLFGSGSTCIRLEKNMKRIAASQGMTVEFSILPHHIHITVRQGCAEMTKVVGIRTLPISFSIITDLSRLSWQIADGHVTIEDADVLLRRICRCPTVRPWTLATLVSLANASFCRLFEGDFVAMAIVFVATMSGFTLKRYLTLHHMDARLVTMICAFISSLITAAGVKLGLGATPDIAVATGVLYLVPGIPFINSFCDILDGHYICAFGRAMHAVVLMCCLSLGLCFAMALMNLAMF